MVFKMKQHKDIRLCTCILDRGAGHMCSLQYCKHGDECNVPCKHTTIMTCMHRL